MIFCVFGLLFSWSVFLESLEVDCHPGLENALHSAHRDRDRALWPRQCHAPRWCWALEKNPHGYPAGYPAGFSRQKPMANPGFPGEPGWLFQAEGGSQRASIHAFDPAVDPGWHSSYISGIIPSYSIHTSWYIHTIFIWLWYTVWISSRISGGSTPLRRTDFLARKFFDFYERLLLSTPSFSTEQLLETSESGDPDFLGSLSAQNPGA